MSSNQESPELPAKASMTDGLWYYRFVVYMATIVALVLIGVLVYAASDVLFLTFAAVLFGVVLNKLSKKLGSKLHLKYHWSLTLIVSAIIGVLVLIGWIGQNTIIEQVSTTIGGSRKAIDQLHQMYQESSLAKKVTDSLPSSASSANLMQGVWRFLAGSFGLFGNLAFVFVVGLFFAADPYLYKNGLIRFLPQSRRAGFEKFIERAGNAMYQWTLGQMFAMIVIAVLTGLSLLILGIPGAILLGVLAGLISFIPTIGAIIAIIPAVLLALQQGTGTALSVVGIYFAIQLLESNFLTPMVQQQQISIAPAVLIVAQLFAGLVFGFVGLAMIAPMMAVLIVFLEYFYFPARDENRSILVEAIYQP